jgi:hypothetical protein
MAVNPIATPSGSSSAQHFGLTSSNNPFSSGFSPFSLPGFQRIQDQIFELLSSRGQTDPRLLNRNITSIQRGGQSRQDAARGEFAGLGLQQSGLAPTLFAAIGEGTANRRAGLEAQEAAMARERQGQDLMLALQLLFNPTLQLRGLQTGLQQSQLGAQTQQSAIDAQQSNNLISALLGFGGTALGGALSG